MQIHCALSPTCDWKGLMDIRFLHKICAQCKGMQICGWGLNRCHSQIC